MARRPRIEFAGAVYPVISGGNREEPIYLDDDDRKEKGGFQGIKDFETAG